MGALKQAYLSMFVLFYKIGEGQWPPAMKADEHKGVAGVSIVAAIALLGASNWLEALLGYHLVLSRVVIWTIAVIVFFANYHILISKKMGTSFEHQFNSLPRPARIARYVLAVVIVVAVGVWLYFSVQFYHRAFGLG